MEKKTLNEWCHEYETKILSKDKTNESEIMTKEQFIDKLKMSIVLFSDKVVEEFREHYVHY